MKRLALPIPIFVLLVALMAQAAPLSSGEREASVGYVRSLQNPDGGFRGTAAAGPSSLGATNSSLRALKYFNGSLPHGGKTRAFVLSCYDPATGGFSDAPGGTPDVRSTAMGLMAMTELKMPLKERKGKIRDFLTQKSITTPDVYIAAAALEPAKITPVSAPLWIARFETTRNPDGTYGDGPMDSATAVITITRLRGIYTGRDAILESFRAAQKSNGGFGAGETSDLGATYRIMRAFYMMRETPDLPRVREFVAKCRNGDGGYGPAPGQPSNASATYFAGIISHWADELEGVR